MRVDPAHIPKLKTAEGTVVQGSSNQTKHSPQRVPRAAVDLVLTAEDRQPAVVADRALGPALEKSEEGTIEMRPLATGVAAICGSGNDPEEKASRTA